MPLIFILEGVDIHKSAVKLATTVSNFASTAGAAMVTIPTSTILNPTAWTISAVLINDIEKALKNAFKGTKIDKRYKFAEDFSDVIDLWFMNATNQAVVSVTIPGAPPVVVPGPAIPNTANAAKLVLKKDLINLFKNVKDKSPMSKSSARKRLNDTIQKYFNSFKVGGEQVWTLAPTLGYLS